MTPEELVEQWLDQKRCTLWSDWCIDDEKGRKKAAQWFLKELEDLFGFIEHGPTSGSASGPSSSWRA